MASVEMWLGILTTWKRNKNISMAAKLVGNFELGRSSIQFSTDGQLEFSSSWVIGFTLSLIELQNIYYVDLSQVECFGTNELLKRFTGLWKARVAFYLSLYSIFHTFSYRPKGYYLTIMPSINFHLKSINSCSYGFGSHFSWVSFDCY